VAIAHNNFGNDLQDQGRYAEAEREHRVALQLLRKAFGAEHPVIAATHNNLGNDLHNQEKYADAEEQHRLALELQRKLLGQSHPHVATSYHNLGHALDLQKRTAEALSHYESAWAIRRDTDGPAEQKAETAFALAKLHWQLGKDADRALELAEIARDALHGAAIRDSDLAVEIDTWLGERRVETVSARAGSRTRGLQPR
jgi:tetratricopeptide (TPR) repeat protein